MTTVGIVGAGYSGLTLALRLQHLGIPSTVYTDAAPDAMRRARLANTVGRFPHTRARERLLGVDHWPDPAESMDVLQFRAGPPLDLGYDGHLSAPLQATDFRVLLPRLMEDYLERGGDVAVVPTLDAELVARRSDRHGLMVVAVGRGSISELFPVDPARSPYREPQRVVFAGLFDGLALPERAVSFNLSPLAGAVFQMVMRTPYGLGTNLLINAVPGGPLTALDGVPTTDPAFTATLVELLRAHAPAIAERIDPARFSLTSSDDWVQVALTPAVRHACCELPTGKLAVAIGDAWITNDPITGQGANLGSQCAWTAADHIAHGGRYDAAFGRRLEAAMWEHARPVTEFTNAFLQPPPPHAVDLIVAAATHQAVADAYVDLFDDPAGMWQTMASPATVAAFVADALAGRATRPVVRAA
jgi:hypothetical protein